MEATTLIRTKLNRPQAVSDLVERPRLVEKLNKGLARKLMLVSAPAGYGKSTVVSAWVETIDFLSAWLSLDEYDDDLTMFGIYVTEAVRTAYPNACQTVTSLLQRQALPLPIRLADAFLFDLEALSGQLALVLDDYHTIQSLDVQAFMKRVVQRLPAHVHLVVISRVDPPLNLPRLRARQQLVELRSDELRFTPEEAKALLHQIAGEPISDEITTLLTERTEGWPVGLQMAGMSLRNSSDRNAFAQRFEQSRHRMVVEFFLSEVLDELPQAQRTHMLQVSIVDRFCAELCETVGETWAADCSGEVFTTKLVRSNLFTIALDDDGVWFRYHHLFRDLLRHRLRQTYSEEAIVQMHQRASN